MKSKPGMASLLSLSRRGKMNKVKVQMNVSTYSGMMKWFLNYWVPTLIDSHKDVENDKDIELDLRILAETVHEDEKNRIMDEALRIAGLTGIQVETDIRDKIHVPGGVGIANICKQETAKNAGNKYFILTDDDFEFKRNKPHNLAGSLQSYFDCVRYMEMHDDCGIVINTGSRGQDRDRVHRHPDPEVQKRVHTPHPKKKHAVIPTRGQMWLMRGAVVRNLEALHPNEYYAGYHRHEYKGKTIVWDDKVHPVIGIAKGGYYIAKRAHCNTIHHYGDFQYRESLHKLDAAKKAALGKSGFTNNHSTIKAMKTIDDYDVMSEAYDLTKLDENVIFRDQPKMVGAFVMTQKFLDEVYKPEALKKHGVSILEKL